MHAARLNLHCLLLLLLLICMSVLCCVPPSDCRYVGFDMIANAAEESSNPRRDIPLATGMCLGVCTLLYAAASTVIVGECTSNSQCDTQCVQWNGCCGRAVEGGEDAVLCLSLSVSELHSESEC